MAGHSKFKNIMHRKGAQDKKRAKLFSRLIREISVATKLGLSDPDSNPRLRTAINNALSANMPKDNIDKAIKKNSNSSENVNIEEIIYEGFGPGGVGIVIESFTDNKNRTASEIRSTFSKYNGNLGTNGSVRHLFNKTGVITYPTSIGSFEEVFDYCVSLSVNDLEEEADRIKIFTSMELFHKINLNLEKKYGLPESSNLEWKPVDLVDLEEGDAIKLLTLIEKLEEIDDVQNISSNFNISENILAKLV